MVCSTCGAAIEPQLSDPPQCLVCRFEANLLRFAAASGLADQSVVIHLSHKLLWAWAYFMYGRPFAVRGGHAHLNRHGRN